MKFLAREVGGGVEVILKRVKVRSKVRVKKAKMVNPAKRKRGVFVRKCSEGVYMEMMKIGLFRGGLRWSEWIISHFF